MAVKQHRKRLLDNCGQGCIAFYIGPWEVDIKEKQKVTGDEVEMEGNSKIMGKIN